MPTNKKNVAIICYLDNYANGIRPKKIYEFLTSKGYIVTVINTIYLSRYREQKTFLPNLIFFNFLLYFVEACSYLSTRYLMTINKYIYYYLLLMQLKLRSKIIYRRLMNEDFDLIICEDQFDAYVLLNKFSCVLLLDASAPWADEYYNGGFFTKKQFDKYQALQIRIYKKVDYLSFHWELYANYVKINIYNGNNLIKMNWGSTIKPKTNLAKYNSNPKIVFLGYLKGPWVNLPLLAKLTKLYKNIDVYGGPPPDKKYDLNYKGYAPTTDILKNYQFGLITITDDKLRRHSFSSKHIEYISYGLPVLAPDWRRDPVLDEVTISYSEKNFLELINKFSKQTTWEAMSTRSYNFAKEMTWDKVLQPLVDIVLKD